MPTDDEVYAECASRWPIDGCDCLRAGVAPCDSMRRITEAAAAERRARAALWISAALLVLFVGAGVMSLTGLMRGW